MSTNAINKTGNNLRMGTVVDGSGLVSIGMKFPGKWLIKSAGPTNKDRLIGVRSFNPGQGWSVVDGGNNCFALVYRDGKHIVTNAVTHEMVRRIRKDPALLRFIVGGLCARMALGKSGGEVVETYQPGFVLNTQYVHMGE